MVVPVSRSIVSRVVVLDPAPQPPTTATANERGERTPPARPYPSPSPRRRDRPRTTLGGATARLRGAFRSVHGAGHQHRSERPAAPTSSDSAFHTPSIERRMDATRGCVDVAPVASARGQRRSTDLDGGDATVLHGCVDAIRAYVHRDRQRHPIAPHHPKCTIALFGDRSRSVRRARPVAPRPPGVSAPIP